MMTIGPVGGVWAQWANIWFFGAAIFSDILLIRICLIGGFVGLIINSLTGLPLSPDTIYATGFFNNTVFLDLLLWAVVTGAFHVVAVVMLVRDEAAVSLPEDAEPVWRYFWRRAGMPRTEFREVYKRAKWQTANTGDVIVTEAESLSHLYLLVEGVVEFESVYNGQASQPRRLVSGALFDLEVCNVFGIRIGFESEGFHAVAKTPCRLLVWDMESMQEMACGPPAMANFWRNLVLFTVAAELNQTHPGQSVCPLDSHGEPEASGWDGGAMSRDFSAALSATEEPPRTTFRSVMSWLRASISPWPPAGLRHNGLPATGLVARNRLLAVSAALRDPKLVEAKRGARLSATAKSVLDQSQHDKRVVRRVTSRLKNNIKPASMLAEASSGWSASGAWSAEGVEVINLK